MKAGRFHSFSETVNSIYLHSSVTGWFQIVGSRVVFSNFLLLDICWKSRFFTWELGILGSLQKYDGYVQKNTPWNINLYCCCHLSCFWLAWLHWQCFRFEFCLNYRTQIKLCTFMFVAKLLNTHFTLLLCKKPTRYIVWCTYSLFVLLNQS